MELDAATVNETSRDMRIAPEYRCPICRETTIEPYHRRPVCHEVDQLAETMHPAKYAAKQRGYTPPDVGQPEEIPQNTSLSTIARASRVASAYAMYKRLLPILLDAARDAQSCVHIRHERTVADAHKVVDLLSLLLFSHGVYRCAVTSGYEGQTLEIDFHPVSRRSEFFNMMHTPSDLDEDVVTPAVRRRMRRRRSPIDTSELPVAEAFERLAAARREEVAGTSDNNGNNNDTDADNTDEGAADDDDAELGSATADLDESLREAIDTIVAQRHVQRRRTATELRTATTLPSLPMPSSDGTTS